MKNVIKISILIIVIGLCLSIKSFAASPYILEFAEQNGVEMGQTIEVPLKLKNINLDDTIKYLKSVKCTIACDENAFEIIDFTSDLNVGNKTPVKYKSENKTVAYLPELGTIDDSLTEITEIGRVRIRIKDNIPEGYYNLFVNNIEAANGNDVLTLPDATTPIYVKGIKQATETQENKDIEQTGVVSENGINVVGSDFKETSLKIQMTKDGKQLIITPDETNGGKIGTLKVNDKEVERKDDKFIVETEPNTYYQIHVYDTNGNIVYSKGVLTTVADDTADNTDGVDNTDNQKEEENKGNENNNNNNSGEDKNNESENKDDNKDNDKKDNEKKDDNKTNTEKENANKSSEDVKKSPQTGDSVYTAIALLVVATCALIIAYGVNYVKEQ